MSRTVEQMQISVGCVTAVSLWVVTVVLLTLSIVLDADDMGRCALVFSAAAATASIRQFMCAFNRKMWAAFELGRDAEKHSGQVRSLY